MKNILLLASILGLLAFGSTSAFAAGPLSPAQKITSVTFMDSGLLIYASNWENPNVCDRNTAVMLLKTDPNYDKAYALLLTAFASGKEVAGYSDGCVVVDGLSYNTIRGHKYLQVR